MKTNISKLFLHNLFIILFVCPGVVGSQPYNWHKQFTGNLPAGSSMGWGTALDASGNVYVVGQFHGTINFGSGNEVAKGFQDFFFAKYSANGSLEWIKNIGETVGGTKSIAMAKGVSLFSSGGDVFLTVSGTFESTSGQAFTVNFDPYFGLPQFDLTCDTEGDAFVARYNVTVGLTMWAKKVTDTDSDVQAAAKITTDLSGNAFVAGSIEMPTGPDLGALRKFDGNGNIVWVKTIGSKANDISWRNNTVFVAGAGLHNNKPLAWYDNDGTVIGSGGNSNYSYHNIALDNGTGIYVTGSRDVNGIYEGVIEKYTTAGGLIWERNFSTGLDGFSMDLALAGSNQSEVVVAGWFKGTVNFNNGQGSEFTITSSGSGAHDNIFAGRYNSASGSCLWVRNNTSTSSSGQSDPIAVAANGSNFYVLGFVWLRTIDADFCGGTANVAANNASNGYIAKYSIVNTVANLPGGGAVICSSGNTISLTNIAAGATVTWSVSPSYLVVTSSGTGPVASLQGQPGLKGAAYITFYLSGLDDCGIPLPSTLGLSLWIGLPNGGIAGESIVYPQQNYFYSNSTPWAIDGGFGYQWTIYGGYFNGINNNEAIALWNESGTLILQYENGCGTTITELPVTVSYEGGCDPCQIVQTYPNPTSDQLVVSLNGTSSGEPTGSAPMEIKLTNDSGGTFYHQVTTDKETRIPTIDFPDGAYMLNVGYKGKKESKHIVIKH